MEHIQLANFRTARTHFRAVITVFFVMLAGTFACNAATPIITQAELLKIIESETALLILDVRSPEEYRSGHIPQSINIPHKQLASRLNELLDVKNREIVTYCERGPRAGVAESVLQEAGFSNVRHLQGDMYLWRRNGLPTSIP